MAKGKLRNGERQSRDGNSQFRQEMCQYIEVPSAHQQKKIALTLPWQTVKWTRKTWKLLFETQLHMEIKDIERIIAGEVRATVAEVFVAKILWVGIQKGDPKYLEFILDRTIGKVRDNKLIHEIANAKPFVMTTLEGEVITMGEGRNEQS